MCLITQPTTALSQKTHTAQIVSLVLLLLERAVKDLREVWRNQSAAPSDNDHGGEGSGGTKRSVGEELNFSSLYLLYMLWSRLCSSSLPAGNPKSQLFQVFSKPNRSCEISVSLRMYMLPRILLFPPLPLSVTDGPPPISQTNTPWPRASNRDHFSRLEISIPGGLSHCFTTSTYVCAVIG